MAAARAPPTSRPSPSEETATELLPLSSRSGAGSSLPPPLPTPPSPASFFKTMRDKAAEAAAAAALSSSGGSGLLPTSSTSPSPERRRRDGRRRDGRRRRLLAASSASLLLISMVCLFSSERVLTGKGSEQEKKAFGQKTAGFVHAKTVKPAAEAAAVASLKMRAFAAAAASRASVSLSATATALSGTSSSPSEEEDALVLAAAAAAADKAATAEAAAAAAAAAAALGQTQPRTRDPSPISTQTLTAFVGVQSRPVTPRRRALRETWFPSTAGERERLLAPFQSGSSPSLRHHGIAFRFVVGLSADPDENLLVAEENRAHDDDIMVLESVRESYDNLVLKTVAFFSAAVELFPGAAFVIKIDDDVYVRPDNLAFVATQWKEAERDYVGCLMKGGEAFDNKKSVYYEPLNALLPDRKYFGYMSGSAYALSRRAALLLRSRTTGKEAEASGPLGGLRPMACEDCAVGLWLLAHAVRHGEDLRMCRYDAEVEEVEVEGEEKATAATAAKRKRHSCAPGGGGQEATPLMAPVVLTNRCNGLCDPLVSLVDLHADPSCRAPTLGAEGVGVGGGLPAGGAGGPSAAVRALPLGDFWSYGRGLSRADAVALECIRFTAEGDVDKSACKEGKKAEKKMQRR